MYKYSSIMAILTLHNSSTSNQLNCFTKKIWIYNTNLHVATRRVNLYYEFIDKSVRLRMSFVFTVIKCCYLVNAIFFTFVYIMALGY